VPEVAEDCPKGPVPLAVRTSSTRPWPPTKAIGCGAIGPQWVLGRGSGRALHSCAALGAAETPPWRHHVIKRAQGGSDFDLDRLVALCPPCHVQTDAPYARGRLVITPLGEGRFTVEVTRGAGKWAIRE